MMRAAFLALCLPLSSWAQTPTATPIAVSGLSPGHVVIDPQFTGAKFEWLVPSSIDTPRYITKGKTLVISAPGTWDVWAIDHEADTVKAYRVTIIGQPGPGPVDTLAAKLRAAYDADVAAGKGNPAELAAIADIYRAIEKVVDKFATVGELKLRTDGAVSFEVDTDLPKTTAAAAAYRDSKLPPDATAPALNKPAIVALYLEIADALGAKPPVPPDPKPPTPSPIPVAGLHVLIVRETGVNLPAAQQSIISGNKVNDYIRSKGGQYRTIDPDQKLPPDQQVWATALTRPRTAVPWLVVSNHPKGGFEGPLPATVDEALAIIKRYAE